MVTLSDYLRAATAERFELARVNCLLWVARWVALQTGINPAADWRGELELDVDGKPTLDVEATAIAAMAPFKPTATPRRGDVGLVRAPQPTAAICLGRRWAALAPQGLAVAAWPFIRAWELPRHA